MLALRLSSALRFPARAARATLPSSPSTTRRFASVQPMDADKFNRLVNDKDARSLYQIVDVREPAELQDVKLKDPGVLNLPLGDAGNWSNKPLSEVGLDAAKPTVCVCKAGIRSMKVAQFLVSKGFEEVYNLEGGMMRILDTNPQITTLG